MALAISNTDRVLHENNTDPNSLAVIAKKNEAKKNGFLSTLASYLTSTAKSDPKPLVVEKKKLINSWDDLDLTKLNILVCNVLYDSKKYETLISEIERVVGRRREYCFYGVLSILVTLILLHDAVGAITAFMTLIIPTFMTVTAISSSSSYENPSFLKDHQDFFVRYWTVYAVFVTMESFLSSLIHWDLRLFRLIFMSMCLSVRIPILAASYGKILQVVSAVRGVIEANNFEKPAICAKTKTG